ncbi:T9SS type A sorting domain-containing protein [Wenyingzhuangia sp. IMCC45533]
MKKRLLLGLLLVVSVITMMVVYDQSHVSKKEYLTLSKNHPIRERLRLTKKERKKLGIPPNKYFDEQYLLEMDPRDGKTHPEHLLKLKEQLHKPSAFFSRVPGQSSEMSWTERGPNNIGGRTRVVFYDPNDSTGKRVFAGGVSGGLWVNNNIEDENSSWTQIGIDENLAISCYAIDPNDSDTWYVGTGEVYTGDDGVGNGIWVTNNGGSTWRQILSIDLTEDERFRPYVVTQILAWNKNGSTEVFYSLGAKFDIDAVGFAQIGWWKFENLSPNRISFSNDNGTPKVFSDLEIAQDNSIWVGVRTNIFGHGGGKIYRSTNGISFEEKYSFNNANRVELTVSKQNPNVVYALASTNNSQSVELVKTTDGNTFISIARPNDVDLDIPANDFARGQGFYNLTLEIDPNDDNILYAGGIDLFRSANGGNSWQQISKWSNNNNLRNLEVSQVHADQHAVAFNPSNSNKGVFANDGGIYYCDNLAAAASSDNVVSRNNNYNITQFYSADISQDVNDEFFLGGTQDNGSLYGGVERLSTRNVRLTTSNGVNSFIDLFGGDGIQNFIDKDSEYLIVSFVNNVYSLYPLPLTSPDDIVEISSDQRTGSFANIADLDDNLDLLYTDGSRYFSGGILNGSPGIFRFENLLTNPRRELLLSPLFTEAPTAIKVSPYMTNASTLFVGTEGASILKVTNANTNSPTWENIDLNNRINIGSISDIELGKDENEIMVTLHNYGVNNIYYTTDGGTTWTEKDGNFPDIPVKTILMNPERPDEVIVGTNMGVWATQEFTSDEPKWFQSFNGMSSVRITKFEMRTADNTVIASTYGRGLFTGKFDATREERVPEEETEETSEETSEDNSLENKIKVKTVAENGDIVFEVDRDEIEMFSVTLYNVNGSLVKEQILGGLISNNKLDASSLSSGIYILNVSFSGERFSKKIIINN